jgi:hypothetical protein
VKTHEDLSQRARELSGRIKADLRYEPYSDGYGDYWTFRSENLKSAGIARAAAALDFLNKYAGRGSEWFTRAKIAWESKGDGESVAAGAHAVAEILELWADDVARGFSHIPVIDASGVRSVASTDLMEQVRMLVRDRSVHPAAPIVLAGAALETALRGAVEQLELAVTGSPGIDAYSKALRAAEVISKQDKKDIDQVGGLRNSAAHGRFDELSIERAGLMEQQVNLLLAALSQLLND